MHVFLDFLGCRLNEAELESWARQLSALGHRRTASIADADLIAVNTCAVTAEAARKSRRRLRALSRRNPGARLVATGCYATLEPEEAMEATGADLVVANGDKSSMVAQMLEGIGGSMPRLSEEPEAQPAFAQSRTRAFVKVQDGCRNRCSFCIVTIARGEERSKPIREVVEELNHLESLGYKEAVLAGVHLGGYGSDLGTDLKELVQAVLADTGLPRIRLGSLEPWDLPEGFFTLFDSPRLCPHLHLPLQSGSNSVLRRMIRRCTVETYSRIVGEARAQNPDFHISTDIIVGFPGETEKEFNETLQTMADLPLGDTHLFTYSPRKGTAAMRIPGRIAKPEAKRRHGQLREIAEGKKSEFLRSLIGQSREVLWERETKRKAGQLHWRGYTDNFVRVSTCSEEALFNQIRRSELLELDGEGQLSAKA
jgi:threonylcarbamoyladenosine tRNA methylthiotransferase MtaB